MRSLVPVLIVVFVIAILGCSYERPKSSKSPVNVQDKLESATRQFLVQDIKQATESFARAMRDSESFALLADFQHAYPERYAALMKEFENERRNGNNFGEENRFSNPYGRYTDYLHKKTEESREFAVKSAIAWQKGWGLTRKEVVPKLRIGGFRSTRRIAIEFLKLENGGDDFGFVWQEGPDSEQNSAAIQKWEEWLKQIISEQDAPADADKPRR